MEIGLSGLNFTEIKISNSGDVVIRMNYSGRFSLCFGESYVDKIFRVWHSGYAFEVVHT